MIFTSVKQLKDVVKNTENRLGLPSNTLLNYYMMERFLCRISESEYADNFVIKGGFLISSLIGIDMRSTMDVDATLKGVALNSNTVRDIIESILHIDMQDQITWEIEKITSIHEEGVYEDFRITLIAHFFNMRVPVKLDITTGDVIIPREIDYSYSLLFGEEKLLIKAYPIFTILAEKIESILARNVSNTRARDFYDIYILLKKNPDLNRKQLKEALCKKAQERKTMMYLEENKKYLSDISKSKELQEVWGNYRKKNSYASNIAWEELIETLNDLMYSMDL
ncbi:nucleotidyl transferase AbiEii/AbiGii toxin family protein [Clostridiales bacterium COT073_COT-073]|nr:nucleotidyl transferase AbiEii/AbiGii toxin family protein [Clostridiales bacterium COT073_COT-073]